MLISVLIGDDVKPIGTLCLRTIQTLLDFDTTFYPTCQHITLPHPICLLVSPTDDRKRYDLMRGTFLHVPGWVCDCPYDVGEQNWSWCHFGHFEFFAKVFHLSWQERRRGLLHWGRVVEEEKGRRHRDGFAHWLFSNFLLILQRYHNLIALVWILRLHSKGKIRPI